MITGHVLPAVHTGRLAMLQFSCRDVPLLDVDEHTTPLAVFAAIVALINPAPVAPSLPLINDSNASRTCTVVAVCGPALTISMPKVSISPAATVAKVRDLMTDTLAPFAPGLPTTPYVAVLFGVFRSGTFGLGESTTTVFKIDPVAVINVVNPTEGAAAPGAKGARAVYARVQVIVAGPVTGAAGKQVQPLLV